MNSTSNQAWRSLLSDREREILELVAKGWSAKQVARLIEISPRTVERHIDNLRMKTHTRNAVHMIAFAYANGILNVEPGETAFTPSARAQAPAMHPQGA